MKILFNNEEVIGEVTTNHSMTIEEAVQFAWNLDSVDDQEGLAKQYEEGNPAVCHEDGEYFIDWEAISMQY